jgi:hypothetical protein
MHNDFYLTTGEEFVIGLAISDLPLESFPDYLVLWKNLHVSLPRCVAMLRLAGLGDASARASVVGMSDPVGAFATRNRTDPFELASRIVKERFSKGRLMDEMKELRNQLYRVIRFANRGQLPPGIHPIIALAALHLAHARGMMTAADVLARVVASSAIMGEV